jgi:hemolysin activation/secretion protein
VVNASATKGQSLDQNKLDRGLAVLQKMVGFNITPSYQAGSVAGSTDLLVKIKDQPLLSGSLLADNTGGRSTGRDKQTATLNFASPFGFGDAINLTMLEAKGVNYGRAAYSIPLGSRGLKLGVNGSYLAYDVIIKDNGIDEIKPKGNSMVYGVDLSYPLYSSKTTNLNIEANYDRKKFVNKRIDGSSYIDSSDYRVDVYSMILSGSHNDSFLAGAINNASLDFGMGHVNLNGSANKTDDFEADKTQGHYKRTRLNISRNQFLTDSLVLSLEGSGQWANRNLDSSEKFYLGGINGVRAYPTSEGAGSEGYMFKLELRKYLPYNFNVSLFMDEGKVRQYENKYRNDNGDPLLEEAPNEYRLKGYGATIGWSGPYNSSIKATYATRMGENPNPAGEEKRNDQDGSLRRHVLWLSGGIAF